ncbi:MAG: DUF6151 family protein [Sulfitobacter sp.]
MTDAPFSCSCGKIKGTLAHATPKGGNHLLCHCSSCRAGALYCNVPLAPGQPVDLFQTLPENVTLSCGQDQLEPFSFGAKNLLRWKAKCCGVQVFSSQRSPKLPVIALVTERLENPEVIGPILSEAFVPKPGGKAGHKNVMAFVKVFGRAIGARLSGRWRQTPLFNAPDFEPIAAITQISSQDRKALLAANT